jgi:hypothetical protein
LPTDTFLKLVLGWPLTESDFKIEKQLAFRQAVAIAAGVVLDSVRIVQVVTVSTRRRMLLSQSTRVTTEIAAKDRSVADAVVGRLTIDKVNAQLQQADLPLATNYEISGISDITPSPPALDKSATGNSIALIGGIVGGVVVVVVVALVAYAFQRRSALAKASGSSSEDGGTSAMKSNLTYTDLHHLQPVSQPVARDNELAFAAAAAAGGLGSFGHASSAGGGFGGFGQEPAAGPSIASGDFDNFRTFSGRT